MYKLRIMTLGIECIYAESCSLHTYADCHYAECHYGDFHGTHVTMDAIPTEAYLCARKFYNYH